MSFRYSSEFTDGEIPPFNLPSDALAFAWFVKGELVYLNADFRWVYEIEPDIAETMNMLLKYLRPGPAQGSKLAYYCRFASWWMGVKVYSRVVENLGSGDVIY